MGCCNHGNTCLSPSASLPYRDRRVAAITSPHPPHTHSVTFCFRFCGYIFFHLYLSEGFAKHARSAFNNIITQLHTFTLGSQPQKTAFGHRAAQLKQFWSNSRAPQRQQLRLQQNRAHYSSTSAGQIPPADDFSVTKPAAAALRM